MKVNLDMMNSIQHVQQQPIHDTVQAANGKHSSFLQEYFSNV